MFHSTSPTLPNSSLAREVRLAPEGSARTRDDGPPSLLHVAKTWLPSAEKAYGTNWPSSLLAVAGIQVLPPSGVSCTTKVLKSVQPQAKRGVPDGSSTKSMSLAPMSPTSRCER